MARLTPVSDPAHPLLADFVALSDPATRRRVEREGDYFVVEGVVAIERLLAQPEWTIRSMALLPKVATRLADQLDGHPAADLAVAVADRSVLGEVVGFDIHRGALASVDRRPPPPIAELVGASGLYLVAEGINDHENLGSLYRNAAAFGAAGVLLDPSSADPFYRRSVRVSSGHVLTVPTATLAPFPEGLEHLRRLGVTTVGLTPGGQDLGDLGPDALGPRPGGDRGRRRGAGAERGGADGGRPPGGHPHGRRSGFDQRGHRRRHRSAPPANRRPGEHRG